MDRRRRRRRTPRNTACRNIPLPIAATRRSVAGRAPNRCATATTQRSGRWAGYRQDGMRSAPVTGAATPEDVKLASNYLGGTIGDELADDQTDFEHDAEILLKFHGIYQQDDRDVRRARTQEKLPLDYSCMVRGVGARRRDHQRAVAGPRRRRRSSPTTSCASPPARACSTTSSTSTSCDELVAGINASLLTTLARVRRRRAQRDGVPASPPGATTPMLEPVVAEMVARFRPQTESLLGAVGRRREGRHRRAAPGATERRARPRRSTRSTTSSRSTARPTCRASSRSASPGRATTASTCTPTTSASSRRSREGTSGELTGFVVLAGGGMGMAHARPDDTYPLLAQPVGWVPPDEIGDVVEAIVTTQRDFGNRDDRNRARLKYTDRGRTASTGCGPDRGAHRAVRSPRRSRCPSGTTTPTSAGTTSTASTRSACRCRRARSSAGYRARAAPPRRRRHRERAAGHRPSGPAARRRHRPRRRRERVLRGQRRRPRRAISQSDAQPGDRLPGAADVQQGARRGRTCAARTWSTSSRRCSPTPATQGLPCAST